MIVFRDCIDKFLEHVYIFCITYLKAFRGLKQTTPKLYTAMQYNEKSFALKTNKAYTQNTNYNKKPQHNYSQITLAKILQAIRKQSKPYIIILPIKKPPPFSLHNILPATQKQTVHLMLTQTLIPHLHHINTDTPETRLYELLHKKTHTFTYIAQLHKQTRIPLIDKNARDI